MLSKQQIKGNVHIMSDADEKPHNGVNINCIIFNEPTYLYFRYDIPKTDIRKLFW